EPIWEIGGGLKITNPQHSPHPAARMLFGESKLPASSRDFHDQRGAFMRVGKYESSEGNTAATAITFLLIGLGAGTLIGLLFAPKSGKQMRKELKRKYDDARETLDDWKDDAKEAAEEVFERGAEIAEEVRDRV